VNPGIYRNVPFADYRAWPLPSMSVFKAGRSSALHMKAAMEGERQPPSDEMLLGTALHCAVLEPELMPQRVACWTGPRRVGREWDSFREQNSDRVILTSGMYENLVGMTQALRRHPVLKQFQSTIEDVEVSAVSTVRSGDNAVQAKARADALLPDVVLDLKSVRSGDPDQFARQAGALGYHIQGAHYCQSFGRSRFILATVENHPPYDVVVYEMDQAFLDKGRSELERLAGIYAYCVKYDDWRGRSDELETLEMPEWMLPAGEEITLDGEIILSGD